MTPEVVRRALSVAALALLLVGMCAPPAAAHAELVSSSPANGERLEVAPREVTMEFTESVNLVERGIALLNRHGAVVPTGEASVDGHTVTFPMPADLPDGPYTVSWRVVSSDGHPVEGALSFGVGADPAKAFGASLTLDSSPPSTTAPWRVVAPRLAGYLAFAVLAGLVVFALWCAPGSSDSPALQRLARVGLVGGLLATLAGLLVQGPYTTGVGMGRLLDPQLLRQTLATSFGVATAWRLGLYAVLTAAFWRLPRLVERPTRWLALVGLGAVAVTMADAGHGAASGRWSDVAVVTVHVITAGIWVGGLIVLGTLGRSVSWEAVHRFSGIALSAVLVLALTGTLNAVRAIHDIDQLFETRYGLVLLLKLFLVAGTIAVASVSRRRLQQNRIPVETVRAEAGLAGVVLAITAVLSMTSPPPVVAPTASTTGRDLNERMSIPMSLGERGHAVLAVRPATTAGSRLRVYILGPTGQAAEPGTRVDLKVSNPGRGVGEIPVPLTRRGGFWVADYRFPFPGRWRATLVVASPDQVASVTGGDVPISD